jgi:hypothetical protein
VRQFIAAFQRSDSSAFPKGPKQGKRYRNLLTALSLVLISGCGAKPKEEDEKPNDPAKEAAEEPKRLYTGSGEATIRNPKGNRPIRYVIRWEKTQLDYTLKQGASTGRLENVSGDLYMDGRVVSKFTANFAIADNEKQVLTLNGHVVVTGIDPKAKPDPVTGKQDEARLSCQKLVWKTEEVLSTPIAKVTVTVMNAYGRVTLTANQGVIGPMDEMWCLPDLNKAGTPGFYR